MNRIAIVAALVAGLSITARAQDAMTPGERGAILAQASLPSPEAASVAPAPEIAVVATSQDIVQPLPASVHVYPAHSWTYNVDFKDPDALAAFIGRILNNGIWYAGARFDPMVLYRVDEAKGEATPWVRSGIFIASNAERANVNIGLHTGIIVAQWVSRAQLAGPLKSAASYWKPLGLADVTATIDLFGGYMPITNTEVVGKWDGGYGFSIVARFGSFSEAASAANAIIKAGL